MKLPDISKSVEKLLAKVPRELAAIEAILVLILLYAFCIIIELRNGTEVVVLLLILLVIATGCTYCLVLHYRSKAEERRIKSLYKLLEHSNQGAEAIREAISRETRRAVNMRGEDEDE